MDRLLHYFGNLKFSKSESKSAPDFPTPDPHHTRNSCVHEKQSWCNDQVQSCELDRFLFEFKFESGKSIEFLKFKFKSSAKNLNFFQTRKACWQPFEL